MIKSIIKVLLYSFVAFWFLIVFTCISTCEEDPSLYIALEDGSNQLQDSILIDTRDAQSYRIRKFGKLWWMIDNLNFDAKGYLYYRDVYIGLGSYYYNNDPTLGEKYGKLYDLSAAVNACPNGWRLPTKNEWNRLAIEYANCEWDENSPTANYRKELPYFEPQAGGKGRIRYDDSTITHWSLGKDGYYWTKKNHYYFLINIERCNFSFNGFSHQATLATENFFSCRCVQEVNE